MTDPGQAALERCGEGDFITCTVCHEQKQGAEMRHPEGRPVCEACFQAIEESRHE